MAFVIYKAIRQACRSMPGEYKTEDGYVYAIFCRDGYIKLGSSRNPRCRVNEQMTRARTLTFDRENFTHFHRPVIAILISGRHQNYRSIERKLHDSLQDWRLVHPRAEKYRLPKNIIRALQRTFEADLSEKAILKLEVLIEPQILREAA